MAKRVIKVTGVKSPNLYPRTIGQILFKADGRFVPSAAWLDTKMRQDELGR